MHAHKFSILVIYVRPFAHKFAPFIRRNIVTLPWSEAEILPVEVIPHVKFLEANDLPSGIRHLSLELTNIKIAMAYIKRRGFRLLARSLNLTSTREFLNSGLRIKFLVGLSERQFITDYEPLQQLIRAKTKLGSESKRLQIRYYNDTKFHPKMFILTNGKRTALLIGSSNITEGGLKNNKEANLLLEAEIDYNAVQNANGFFDQLWMHAHQFTKKELEIYKQDKEKYQKTKPPTIQSGRLPKGGLPSRPIPKIKELYLFIEDIQYPLSKIHSYCTECGRPTPIPQKWLKWWKCERHGQGRYILRKKADTKIHLAYLDRRVKGIRKVEGECLYKKKDGTICGAHFSLDADFSHQICRRCYERRRKERKPCSRIPRTLNLDESFYYDTYKKMILAPS